MTKDVAWPGVKYDVLQHDLGQRGVCWGRCPRRGTSMHTAAVVGEIVASLRSLKDGHTRVSSSHPSADRASVGWVLGSAAR